MFYKYFIFLDKTRQILQRNVTSAKEWGKIVIGFRDDNQMSRLNLSEDIFNAYSLDEVVSLLSYLGFSDSHIIEKDGKPLLSYCAVAIKPANTR